MFDVNWSELLILAVVALIVVGPKELPVLLRTIGRYAGMARRQASEFRSHFEDAMREAEMAELREEMDSVRREVMGSVEDVERSVKSTVEFVGEGKPAELAEFKAPAQAALPAAGDKG